MSEDRLPPVPMTPEDEAFNRKLSAEYPGSNVADSIRLRDALSDLEKLRAEVNRLDRAIERATWIGVIVASATVATAGLTVRIMWSTDRMAHYAALSYHQPPK